MHVAAYWFTADIQMEREQFLIPDRDIVQETWLRNEWSAKWNMVIKGIKPT